MRRSIAQLLLGLAGVGAALNPIEVQGQNFVDSVTGDRFEVIGMDYQPGGEAGFDPTSGEDPLSDGDICLRDAGLMQQMGINTIRAYNLDPYISHDECASIFNAAGIYMFVDVNSPLDGDSINRADPESSYTTSYLNRTFAVVQAFRNYPNVIGFFSANEVINDDTTAEENPPFMRAVTRDLKQYIAARGGRPLPVGYAAADVRNVLVDTSNYMQCTIEGEGQVTSRSDFFALNSYSWCGDSNFETSTYDDLAEDFAGTTIPVFFGEFGCIEPSPRVFNEIPALYGPRMTTWSGGLIYQWTEEGSPEGDGYGLINVNDDGSVETTVDFNTLQTRYSELDYEALSARNTTAVNLEPPECSADLITDDAFSTDFDIPNAPDGTQQMINNGVPAAEGSIISVTRTVANVAVTPVSAQAYTGVTVTPVPTAARANPATNGNGGGSSNEDGSGSSNAAGLGRSSASPMAGLSLASCMLWLLG